VYIGFHVSSFSDFLVTAMQLFAKGNFSMAKKLLFYIARKEKTQQFSETYCHLALQDYKVHSASVIPTT
jgi:hypothetical protein